MLFLVASVGQNYKVEQTSEHGIPIVRLVDTVDGVEVSILPSIGIVHSK